MKVRKLDPTTGLPAYYVTILPLDQFTPFEVKRQGEKVCVNINNLEIADALRVEFNFEEGYVRYSQPAWEDIP